MNLRKFIPPFEYIYMLISLYMSTVVSSIKMYWLFNKGRGHRPLPDIVLDTLFYWGRSDLTDMVLSSFVCTAIIIVLVCKPSYHRAIVASIAWLHLLRGITVLVTQVPDCDSSEKVPVSVAQIFIPWSFPQLLRRGDMMFSGHAATCTLLFCVYSTLYSLRNGSDDEGKEKTVFAHIPFLSFLPCPHVGWLFSIPFYILMTCWYLFTLFTVIACRYHYTSDVIIGVYMGYLVWNRVIRNYRKDLSLH